MTTIQYVLFEYNNSLDDTKKTVQFINERTFREEEELNEFKFGKRNGKYYSKKNYLIFYKKINKIHILKCPTENFDFFVTKNSQARDSSELHYEVISESDFKKFVSAMPVFVSQLFSTYLTTISHEDETRIITACRGGKNIMHPKQFDAFYDDVNGFTICQPSVPSRTQQIGIFDKGIIFMNTFTIVINRFDITDFRNKYREFITLLYGTDNMIIDKDRFYHENEDDLGGLKLAIDYFIKTTRIQSSGEFVRSYLQVAILKFNEIAKLQIDFITLQYNPDESNPTQSTYEFKNYQNGEFLNLLHYDDQFTNHFTANNVEFNVTVKNGMTRILYKQTDTPNTIHVLKAVYRNGVQGDINDRFESYFVNFNTNPSRKINLDHEFSLRNFLPFHNSFHNSLLNQIFTTYYDIDIGNAYSTNIAGLGYNPLVFCKKDLIIISNKNFHAYQKNVTRIGFLEKNVLLDKLGDNGVILALNRSIVSDIYNIIRFDTSNFSEHFKNLLQQLNITFEEKELLRNIAFNPFLATDISSDNARLEFNNLRSTYPSIPKMGAGVKVGADAGAVAGDEVGGLGSGAVAGAESGGLGLDAVAGDESGGLGSGAVAGAVAGDESDGLGSGANAGADAGAEASDEEGGLRVEEPEIFIFQYNVTTKKIGNDGTKKITNNQIYFPTTNCTVAYIDNLRWIFYYTNQSGQRIIIAQRSNTTDFQETFKDNDIVKTSRVVEYGDLLRSCFEFMNFGVLRQIQDFVNVGEKSDEGGFLSDDEEKESGERESAERESVVQSKALIYYSDRDEFQEIVLINYFIPKTRTYSVTYLDKLRWMFTEIDNGNRNIVAQRCQTEENQLNFKRRLGIDDDIEGLNFNEFEEICGIGNKFDRFKVFFNIVVDGEISSEGLGGERSSGEEAGGGAKDGGPDPEELRGEVGGGETGGGEAGGREEVEGDKELKVYVLIYNISTGEEVLKIERDRPFIPAESIVVTYYDAFNWIYHDQKNQFMVAQKSNSEIHQRRFKSEVQHDIMEQKTLEQFLEPFTESPFITNINSFISNAEVSGDILQSLSLIHISEPTRPY